MSFAICRIFEISGGKYLFLIDLLAIIQEGRRYTVSWWTVRMNTSCIREVVWRQWQERDQSTPYLNQS